MPKLTSDNNKYGYGTRSELIFILGLGSHKDVGNKKEFGSLSRLALLKNYLKAAIYRDNWGFINKDIILETVKQEIEEAEMAINCEELAAPSPEAHIELKRLGINL